MQPLPDLIASEAAFGHGVDDLRRQLQPVEQRRIQAAVARGLQIQRIGLLQHGRVLAQPRRQAAQGGVALRRGGCGHDGGRGTRGSADLGHVGGDVGGGH